MSCVVHGQNATLLKRKLQKITRLGYLDRILQCLSCIFYLDIVLLTARIGENVSNSEHSCFMYSADIGVTKPSNAKRVSNTTATAISSDAVVVLEPKKSESVDIHALKSRFEARSDVSPSITHAKPTFPALGCTEKPAARTTEGKGSDIGKVVSRSQSLSLQDLLENSESKTSTIPRSDARELGKNVALELAEEVQQIRKPRKIFFFTRPDSKKKEMTRLRAKSQENLLDISEKGYEIGSCAGARYTAAHSFQEKKLASKSTDVEVLRARNLSSALAVASSSDDDHDSYEDANYNLPSEEEANSAARRSFQLSGRRTNIQSDSKSSKDSKPKKSLDKSPKSKRPLPLLPKEDSKTGKFPEMTPKEAGAQEPYMKISHSAAAFDDSENQYASLREDFDSSGGSFSVPPSDDVSWMGAEKEWRKMKDAAEIPRDVNVARLTVDEVGHCLRLLKMKKYVKKFKRRVVDGAVLVTLTDAMLMETFKMDQLDARKIVMFSKDNWRPSKK